MLQLKAWKSLHKREGRETDVRVSIGVFNGQTSVCPPLILTEAQAIDLIGPQVKEWGAILTYPLKVEAAE